jgi:hypothetical protein
MTEDQMMLLTAIAVAITTILAAWFAVVRLIRPMYLGIRRRILTWENFMADWSGEKARPGRGATLGVMERLSDIDGNLKNNGGNSLKDSVDKVHQKLDEGNKNIYKLDRRIYRIEKKLEMDSRPADDSTPIEKLIERDKKS